MSTKADTPISVLSLSLSLFNPTFPTLSLRLSLSRSLSVSPSDHHSLKVVTPNITLWSEREVSLTHLCSQRNK